MSIDGRTTIKNWILSCQMLRQLMSFLLIFGATLDLGAAEKDDCSIDNHTVIGIFFVISNWRQAKYEKKIVTY